MRSDNAYFFLKNRGLMREDIPVYNIIKHEVQNIGLCTHYRINIIIDAPFGVGLHSPVGLIGMGFGSSTPHVLKFDESTQIAIDGKIYTVLLRDIYEPIEMKQ